MTLVTTLDSLVVDRQTSMPIRVSRANITESTALESAMLTPRPCSSSSYGGIADFNYYVGQDAIQYAVHDEFRGKIDLSDDAVFSFRNGTEVPNFIRTSQSGILIETEDTSYVGLY